MNRLAIFDMDGVLVDTERLYRRMNLDFLQSIGHHMNDEQYDAFIGIHAREMWRQWKDRYGLEGTVGELVLAEREAKYRLLERTDLIPMDGLLPLLISLIDEGFQLAVASSSLRRNVDLVLDKLEIRSFFNAVVSGDEVLKGKPDPEIFRKAASLTGVEPGRAVVIEDAKNGVLAAKAAGMKAIGLQRTASGNQDLSMADAVVGQLSEITMAMCRA